MVLAAQAHGARERLVRLRGEWYQTRRTRCRRYSGIARQLQSGGLEGGGDRARHQNGRGGRVAGATLDRRQLGAVRRRGADGGDLRGRTPIRCRTAARHHREVRSSSRRAALPAPASTGSRHGQRRPAIAPRRGRRRCIRTSGSEAARAAGEASDIFSVAQDVPHREHEGFGLQASGIRPQSRPNSTGIAASASRLRRPADDRRQPQRGKVRGVGEVHHMRAASPGGRSPKPEARAAY